MTFGAAARRAAHLASAVLGWRPSDFWAATPAELITSLGLDQADGSETGPASAQLLQQMMEQYPDGQRNP